MCVPSSGSLMLVVVSWRIASVVGGYGCETADMPESFSGHCVSGFFCVFGGPGVWVRCNSATSHRAAYMSDPL